MRRLGRIRPALEALGRMANDKTNLGDARARGDHVKDDVIEADKPGLCACARPRFRHYSIRRERPSTLTRDTPRARRPRRWAETLGLSASKNRNGQSAATPRPIREPSKTRTGARPFMMRRSPDARSTPSSDLSIASARHKLPGPLANRASSTPGRRARIISVALTGSAARINTAAPIPGRSVVTLRQK